MGKLKLGIMMSMILSSTAFASFVSASDELWDFENGKYPYWDALYDNADMAIDTEENGNRYLTLSYNGAAHRDREYYDVKVADVSTSYTLQADYDIMYPEVATEKNGEIQFKNRTGPGTSETTMAARFGKHTNYFRTQNVNNVMTAVKGTDGKTLVIEPGHWYSVKLIVDFVKCKQSVYIFDRDTQELLSYSEPTATINNANKINMVTFSSGTEMCLDNVRVYESDWIGAQIYGSPYISSATKNKYYMLGKNQYGFTMLPEGDVTWSLETPRRGVSVDSPTGRIIVGSAPEPGPVILKAEKTSDDISETAKFIVYISK